MYRYSVIQALRIGMCDANVKNLDSILGTNLARKGRKPNFILMSDSIHHSIYSDKFCNCLAIVQTYANPLRVS